jgi:hypothetical protein
MEILQGLVIGNSSPKYWSVASALLGENEMMLFWFSVLCYTVSTHFHTCACLQVSDFRMCSILSHIWTAVHSPTSNQVSENWCRWKWYTQMLRWKICVVNVFRYIDSNYKHFAKIFFLRRCSPNFGFGLPPWNSPFHFGFIDLRQSVGHLGRMISSSQGLYLYINTENARTHKH